MGQWRHTGPIWAADCDFIVTKTSLFGFPQAATSSAGVGAEAQMCHVVVQNPEEQAGRVSSLGWGAQGDVGGRVP